VTADEARAAVRLQLSPARAAHSERVAETAAALAASHGLDAAAAHLAGLLHDWYRELPAAEIVALARSCGALPPGAADADVVPSVLHGPVAARLLPSRWPELPPAVLQAIDRHTTGDPAMTAFDCCLFVGDAVEPGHSWEGVEELRRLAARDLWAATLAVMDAGLRQLLERGRAVDLRTVAARNALLRRRHAGPQAPGGG
jgi:predicted HD superfamily hydrolase involved in NAD metabolism